MTDRPSPRLIAACLPIIAFWGVIGFGLSRTLMGLSSISLAPVLNADAWRILLLALVAVVSLLASWLYLKATMQGAELSHGRLSVAYDDLGRLCLLFLILLGVISGISFTGNQIPPCGQAGVRCSVNRGF